LYWNRVVRTLVWTGLSTEEAMDAAQIAFMAAYSRWPEIDKPEAWLLKVAHHATIRNFRKRERELLVGDIAHMDEISAASSESSIGFEAGVEVQAVVEALLKRLPPRTREVIVLYCDGLATREIANILGISQHTVRSLLRYGREKLRELRPYLE
jgi:RNA polymerase sigma factor (sigma-70 family)